MQESNHAQILGIIDVLKTVYKHQAEELNRKIENFNYINITVLMKKIEKEIPTNKIAENSDKIISIIESVIQD